MAASDSVKTLQAAALCSICLDYFKDPVTLRCGHNFCRECLTHYCKRAQASYARSCPECRDQFPEGEFQVNRQLREMAKIAQKISPREVKESRGERVCMEHEEPLKLFCEVDETPICLVCRESQVHRAHTVAPIREAAKNFKGQIQSRLELMKKEKDEVLALKSSEDRESQKLLKQTNIERHNIVAEFNQLHRFLEEQERLLLAQLEELDKEIVKRREEYVAKLSAEISSLGDLISEMEKKCRQPESEFLQGIRSTQKKCEREKFQHPVAFSPEIKWKIWEFSQRNPFLKRVTKTFRDTVSATPKYSTANVTLDPDTAQPRLVLSEDRKSMIGGDIRQRLPDNPERFDTEPFVLGRDGFTSGRHCWEVEVKDEGDWGMGVARESVRRKGEISLNIEMGTWAVERWEGEYTAITSPITRLPLSRPPKRIWVYLDYVWGQVAFLNANTSVLIYVFPPASFSGERIYPFFWVGLGSQFRLHP
uniref:Zinc finger protein RFP-like n=1 Tax=Sphenodon punctatus TaxID=8508 RepID=A0A8D0G004_SPHPU